MKLCSEHCVACCDFCRLLKRLGEYDGVGICSKDNAEVQLYWHCDDFECFRIKEDN